MVIYQLNVLLNLFAGRHSEGIFLCAGSMRLLICNIHFLLFMFIPSLKRVDRVITKTDQDCNIEGVYLFEFHNKIFIFYVPQYSILYD